MLPGVTSMGPLEVEPELDLPLWSFLSTASPDWMLPGVGDLAEHEVVGVETNPTFVRALLVGANWQVASELRWRNVPLVPRSSPLRRFWQREPGTPPKGSPNDVYDIRPVRFWEPDVALGDGKLSPTNRGSEAVVVFNTPLFRRYPTTVVYLYDARPTDVSPPDWAPPDPNLPLQATKRVEPTFTGTIGTDVTFFGFPYPPQPFPTTGWCSRSLLPDTGSTPSRNPMYPYRLRKSTPATTPTAGSRFRSASYWGRCYERSARPPQSWS